MDAGDIIAFWRTGQRSSPLADAGLRSVAELATSALIPADERPLLEKARSYGASHVFFRAREGRSRVADALVFDDATQESARTNEEFAQLHRRLWSWGAVPLVYRRVAGRVDLFRCGTKPDFDRKDGAAKYHPYAVIETASDITGELEKDPWWDLRRLANGTLWDDANVAGTFLSEAAAHKTLLRQVEALDDQLARDSKLAANLRRRLLIISLLVAYLEDRNVFKLQANFFSNFKEGAEKFFDVLSDAEALINLLAHLEKERFNGNVFALKDEEKDQLRKTRYLRRFAELIEGNVEGDGQQTLWRLYSFHDLPVELISHIYQLFVEDKSTCVYTPPFLARLMLEEALTLDRMDRMESNDEIVFDPSCGSGVFLVEAFKRLVTHWRKNNNWDSPPVEVLRKLMQRVGGIDIDGCAVELAAFSLCLAMCEELSSAVIWKTRKLFPTLKDKTLVEGCFFQSAREQRLPHNLGVMVGNPPFGSASDKGTTTQAYDEYIANYGEKSLPDKQSAYLFLHHSLEALVPGGLMCLLQKDNFIYNRRSVAFRHRIFERWDVREILDFTPIRGMFKQDPKVVVVLAEATAPKPERLVLHAVFRRTVRTRAEQSFELDYYDTHWIPRPVIFATDFIWRCNLFGGGRTVSLVARLKNFPTLKSYIKDQQWTYGEGYIAGKPKNDEVSHYLWKQPVISAKAVTEDGKIDANLITIQTEKNFYDPGPEARYKAPLILITQADDMRVAYWKKGNLTYSQRLLGISGASGSVQAHSVLFKRLYDSKRFFRSWLVLASAKAGIEQATTLQKKDIDDLPFPKVEADLDLSTNEKIVLADAADYYRDFQRLGDAAEIMRVAVTKDYTRFARVFSRQINTVHKKLRPLPAMAWAGICCQPFVFGEAVPDWSDTISLTGKLAALLRGKNGPTLTTIRIVRLFDGPFMFLIKPDRLRYWIRSIALRDADEALADLRSLGF